MNFQERLKYARKAQKLSQVNVAENIEGLTQSAYSQLERGDSKSTTKMVELATLFKVSPHWLATGEGEMTPKQPVVQSNISGRFERVSEWSDDTPLEEDEYAIPFYKDIAFACGHGAINEDYHERRQLRMGKYTLRNLGIEFDNAIAVTARDDSMSPYIQDGDTIFIDKGRTTIKDGRIFALRHGELHLCKRLYRAPDGGVRVVSDNDVEFPTYTITKSEIMQGEFEIIGWVWSVSRLERW